MSASRLPLLALLLTASLASGAQAASGRDSASAAPDTPVTAAASGRAPAVTRPTKAAASTTPAPRATPSKRRAGSPAASAPAPVSKDSVARRPLHPRRDPLLARHPAATCALDPLEAVGLRQHARARESLREFYWSDMARFFETSVDLAEPVPAHVPDPAFLTSEQVLRDLPAAARTGLATIAAARVVDRLGGRELNKVSKLLASLGPAQVAGLLRADSPTLRAYVWTWLATTRTGGCHLGHLDLDFIEAAVADRSLAVEHGDDLVYRSLGDYALAARARLATLDPARFDAFLARLTAAAEVDPLVRAAAHGVLLRRGHWDTQALGLRDLSPAVRAATAAAAIEMNRDRVEPALLEHAAADPADLVTELIVGALLGVYDPHNHGRPQLRGALASARDERLTAAVARWRGRGDPLEPLPAPRAPLRFTAPAPEDRPSAPASTTLAAPAPKDMSRAPARTTRAAPAPQDMSRAPAHGDHAAPVPEDMSRTPARATPVAADSPAARAEPVARAEPEPTRPARQVEPALPGVLDEPEDAPSSRP